MIDQDSKPIVNELLEAGGPPQRGKPLALRVVRGVDHLTAMRGLAQAVISDEDVRRNMLTDTPFPLFLRETLKAFGGRRGRLHDQFRRRRCRQYGSGTKGQPSRIPVPRSSLSSAAVGQTGDPRERPAGLPRRSPKVLP